MLGFLCSRGAGASYQFTGLVLWELRRTRVPWGAGATVRAAGIRFTLQGDDERI